MSLADHIKKSGYYRIRIVPNQSKTEFRGVMADGTFKIAVNAPREKGRANAALMKFLCSELPLDKQETRISSGLTNPTKIVFVEFRN